MKHSLSLHLHLLLAILLPSLAFISISRGYVSGRISEPSYSNILYGTIDDMKWDPKSAPKLDFEEDLYSVLEADPAFTPQELKRAYYKVVFRYHPDNKEGVEAKSLCNKQMMVINAGIIGYTLT